MQIHFGRKRQIRFTDKTHPTMGIISVIIGAVSWAALIALCVLSYSTGGKSGLISGVCGILVLMVAILGFIFAARCYKKEDIYIMTPVAGSLLNGFMIVICVILYVIGSV